MAHQAPKYAYRVVCFDFVVTASGHGIYTTQDEEKKKYASVAGFVTKVNNLFLVQPVKARYV
jgi:exosome complex RNA-binding protein Rrp4